MGAIYSVQNSYRILCLCSRADYSTLNAFGSCHKCGNNSHSVISGLAYLRNKGSPLFSVNYENTLATAHIAEIRAYN